MNAQDLSRESDLRRDAPGTYGWLAIHDLGSRANNNFRCDESVDSTMRASADCNCQVP